MKFEREQLEGFESDGRDMSPMKTHGSTGTQAVKERLAALDKYSQEHPELKLG